jgi:predicted alpha/beta superfamily hydrolase
MEEEKQFTSRLDQENTNIEVLITVGELEKNHKSRMNDNAKELSERLSVLSSRGARVEFKEFEGENHTSVLPSLISRSLRFALIPHGPKT